MPIRKIIENIQSATRKRRASQCVRGSGIGVLGIFLAGVLWFGVDGLKAVPAGDPVHDRTVQRAPAPVVPYLRPDAVSVVEPGIASLLKVQAPMSYGQFVWSEKGVPQGPTWVRVDLTRQIISVFRAGHEIGTAVILYGTPEKPTPAGQFAILAKRADHRSNLYDAEMPFTLRLTHDGISIHGSDVRPRTGTHGCVGVPLKFAKLLFEQSSVGDRVQILG